MSFSRAANPIWFFVDLVGQPLNDEYYISFLTNTLPYLPQPVYHDDQGITPWANPLEFYPNGTLPDDLYFNDELVYRLEIRHGNTQNDALIYVINNYIPNGNVPVTTITSNQTNQISNPQFAFINFVSPLAITLAGTYNIAPDWFLTLAGTGTATVEQVISLGTDNQPDSPVPPYFIKITTDGWNSATLFQRFSGVADIWANQFVSMSILAKSDNGLTPNVTLAYAPSTGSPTELAVKALSAGDFTLIQGSAAIPTSTNGNPNNVSYVDMEILLPTVGIVEISDVQVIGTPTLVTTPFVPQPDETLERQGDHLFHYYAQSLISEPKTNLLTGWTFAQNPFQFSPTAPTIASSQTQYICDQTILHQETASAYSVTLGSSGLTYALQLTPQVAVPANRFALIQYIDYRTAFPYFGQILSSMVRALINTSHSTVTKLKARLIYRTAGDAIPNLGNAEPISGWDSNGDVTFAAGWTALKPLNDPAYALTGIVNNQLPEFSYDQFQLPSPVTGTPYLGIVLYINTVVNSATTADVIAFYRVSLVPNDFAIDASPETFDETLRKCEYYFEKSYATGTLQGEMTGVNSLTFVDPLLFNNAGTYHLPRGCFEVQYKTTKCQIPIFEPYPLYQANMGNNVDFKVYNNANGPSSGSNPTQDPISNWVATFEGTDSIFYVGNGGSIMTFDNSNTEAYGTIQMHYLADARLGIV